MNLSGNLFEYGGVSSARYGGLIIAEIETQTIRAMSGNISYSSIRGADGRHRHMAGVVVSDEPLTFELEFVRETPISRHEAREIARWLFHRSDYQRLYVDRRVDDTRERVDGDMKRCYLECVFYNPQRIEYADGLHGWKCTCECAHHMALQEAITKTFNQEALKGTIVVDVDSDSEEYVRPTIQLDVTTIDKEDIIPEGIVSNYVLGDINQDGQISSYDYLLALWASTKKISLSNEQIILGDLNKNGQVDAEDTLTILQYATGKISDANNIGIGKTHPTIPYRGITVVMENIRREKDENGQERKRIVSSMAISDIYSNDQLSIDCRQGTITNVHNEDMQNYYSRVADQTFFRLLPGHNEIDIYALTLPLSPSDKSDPQRRDDLVQSVSITWNNERWIL